MAFFPKTLKLVALIGLFSLILYAQDEMEYRASASLRFSPIKKVKLYFSPELRFENTGLDKLVLDAEVKYSPIKHLDVGGSYALILNKRNNNPTELINRFSVYIGTDFKWERLTPELRLMYTNYDEDSGNEHFLRYKAKLNYDIANLKVDPYLAAELYQQLSDGALYKMRYAIGADWRFAKDHAIGLEYKLDDYMDADKVKHIIGVGYSFKF